MVQPSAQRFWVFARLLSLGAGGEIVYFGDVGPSAMTLIQYFEGNGSRPCGAEDNLYVSPFLCWAWTRVQHLHIYVEPSSFLTSSVLERPRPTRRIGMRSGRNLPSRRLLTRKSILLSPKGGTQPPCPHQSVQDSQRLGCIKCSICSRAILYLIGGVLVI